jgi:NADPH-dependent 2,4-dienoyl-CoA reductase/sulfur reductase-like enzyme
MDGRIAAVARPYANKAWRLPRMTERSFEFQVVVVGAGPAGLAAACAAAESGARAAVVDDTPWLGGQIWRGQLPGATACMPASSRSPIPQARQWFERFRRSGAALLDQTSVIALPKPGLLLAEHHDGPRQIRWQRLVLATGARELFLPFPGWTLPGVMGPGGMQALVKNGWPTAGQRVLVAGSGPLLLAVADGLKKHGAKVISIAEQAPWSRIMNFSTRLARHPAKLWQAAQLKLRLTGVAYRCGVWPLRAEGDEQVRSVTLTDGRRTRTETCDLLACGFGLAPNVELPLALGCELNEEGCVRVDADQATSVAGVYCAGEPTGIGGADCALIEGQIAGYAAASNRAGADALFAQRASWHRFRSALAAAFALRSELKSLAADETIVCRCEDVTLGRVRQFNGWRDAKLQTRCGMGACQGRICGAATKFILGWGMGSVRPPVLPARVQSLISKPARPLATTSQPLPASQQAAALTPLHLEKAQNPLT